MRIFYIDIYFLINFTVDLLALYFATLFFRIPARLLRLCLSAGVGALTACALILLSEKSILSLLLAVPSLFLMLYIAAGRVRLFRFLRFALGFLFLELLLGGTVYFLYGALERLFDRLKIETNYGAENRKLLLFAVLVLLGVGALHLVSAALASARGEHICEVSFSLFERQIRVCALVDSGNLLRDPFDGTAVMLWKAEEASAFLPPALFDSRRIAERREGKSHLRLIPVRRGDQTRMLCGYRAEHAEVEIEKRRESVKLVIAIDEEDGTYGGYGALLPSAVLDAC